jgi:hypothetical protein
LAAAPAPREPGRPDSALPANGGRIALVSGNRPLGWLDIWGNGADAGVESRRAVTDVARLVGIILASVTVRS